MKQLFRLHSIIVIKVYLMNNISHIKDNQNWNISLWEFSTCLIFIKQIKYEIYLWVKLILFINNFKISTKFQIFQQIYY